MLTNLLYKKSLKPRKKRLKSLRLRNRPKLLLMKSKLSFQMECKLKAIGKIKRKRTRMKLSRGSRRRMMKRKNNNLIWMCLRPHHLANSMRFNKRQKLQSNI